MSSPKFIGYINVLYGSESLNEEFHFSDLHQPGNRKLKKKKKKKKLGKKQMSKLVAANSGCNWRVSHLGGSGVAVRGSGADNTGVMDEREGLI